MSNRELIFFPSPAPGHTVSTLEFAKRLIAVDPHLSITVLVINSPILHPTPINNTTSISRATFGGGAIRFVDLPQVRVPSPSTFKASPENALSLYIAAHEPHVREVVASRLQDSSSRVCGLVLDMFCVPLVDVALELGLPSYLFFCTSAVTLGFFHHLLDRPQKGDEADPDVLVSCFQNPIPARALPAFVFNKLGWKALVENAKRFRETKGIIVNTCSELEPYAVKSLLDAFRPAQLYTVGPVLDLNAQARRQCEAGERDRIMQWLNLQPKCSVVYLSFGNDGSMDEDQIKEISKGLTKSGQRFLWALQKPPTDGSLKYTAYSSTELKRILQEDEFWSLIEKKQGILCGWAPQLEILAHNATGAFVSHCGWNSTLESVWFGKPMVTWPLYADQSLIAFEVVRELGVAVELTFNHKSPSPDLVEAADVERALRCVMEEDNPVRRKAEEMAEVCRASLMEGGSSMRCIQQLVEDFHGCKGNK